MRTTNYWLFFTCFSCVAAGACADEPKAKTEERILTESASARARVASLRAFIGSGSSARFVDHSGPRVTLPADAAGAVEIADPRSSVTARFALRAALPQPIETADGFAVYENALPEADLVFRVDARGVEDFLAFAKRPPVEAVEYALDVTRVKGLRQIGEVLELMDAHGAPRLRVLPPAVIDRAGAFHRARLDVRGCAVDHDPRQPWGRPVTEPGASSCTLQVAWDGLHIQYPAIVDPHWVATKDMAAPRGAHTATLLANGKVLVAGGGNNESSAELYDEGTDTFAATGAMTTARSGHTAVLLPNGKVLLASGGAGPLGFILSSELYDPTTGMFTASGDENEMHGGAPFVLLPNGKVLVAAGNNHFGNTDAAELYDPATGEFTYTGSLVQSRGSFSATSLDDGTVLIAGGTTPLNPGELDSAEIYDPVTGQFAATDSLSDLRAGHTGTLLTNGKVLIAGGDQATNLTTELYDPVLKKFSLGPDLVSAQSDQRDVRLKDGSVVLAGGGDELNFTKTVQLYDPVLGTVTKIAPMLSPRADFTLTLLPSDNLLAVGGYDVGGAVTPLFSAERLVPGDALENGGSCTSAAECSSGFCVDGVCCETKCDGQCESCNLPNQAGSCEAVSGDPVAPHPSCTGSGEACGGQCDGTHRDACNYPTTATSCGSSCGDGMLTASLCDGKGTCAAGAPAACPNELGCADVTSCATACTTSAECAADHVCVASQCVASCDGDHTLTAADGSKTDCTPYACDVSACKTACTDDTDCSGTATCKSGKCVDGGPKTSGTSDDSSGCSLGKSSDSSGSLLLVSLGLALAVGRRRRRLS